MKRSLIVFCSILIMLLSCTNVVETQNDAIILEEFETTAEVISGLDSNTTASKSPYNNNYAKVIDYRGFNKNYWGGSISAYARTRLSPLNPFDPPEWRNHINGNFYKNHHIYSQLPSTTSHTGALDLRVDSVPDYSARSGDYYELDSFHRVYDYYGTTIWDKTHYDSTTF